MPARFTRRDFLPLLASPLAAPILGPARSVAQDAPGDIFLCMHQATSTGHDFETAMRGYARAGVRAVEVDLASLRAHAERHSVAAARRLLDDLGLTPVSSSNALFIEETGPRRAAAIEDLKWKVELDEAIGCDRLVTPSAASERHTASDYAEVLDNLIEAAEIARPHGVTLMIEFTRLSTLINNLRTALYVVREADHPNIRVMMDTFHFWSGMSKLSDLELLRPGELHHLHFEDVPGEPPLEVFEQRHRVLPGQGIAPLGRILESLKARGYSGPASVELFDPAFQAMAPYDAAMAARAAVEPYLG